MGNRHCQAGIFSSVKTDLPCALMAEINSSTRSAWGGDKPIVSSSMQISLGRPISARAIATIGCSPPDSVSARYVPSNLGYALCAY